MELLNRIQKELKVPKGQYNSFAKYNYRNCEDILEAVKPLLGDAVLTLSDEVVEVGGRCYVKATAKLEVFVNSQGGQVYSQGASATGYAREALDKKGMDEAQITGAASSYARKYALCGLFCIDDGKDADADDNSDVRPAAKPVPPKQVADTRTAKKKLIAELLLKTASDPLTPMETKEQFEEQCRLATGLELVEENYEAILDILQK